VLSAADQGVETSSGKKLNNANRESPLNKQDFGILAISKALAFPQQREFLQYMSLTCHLRKSISINNTGLPRQAVAMMMIQTEDLKLCVTSLFC
jgi:hypothetical protein